MPVGMGITNLLGQSFVTGGVEASKDDGDGTGTPETALDRSASLLAYLRIEHLFGP
jgi:hypothetical protein